MVTLGAWGGYITFHFDHPVANIEGEKDFAVWGNANLNGAEPAIVMVSQDTNGNHLPDDEWPPPSASSVSKASPPAISSSSATAASPICSPGSS